MKICEINKIKSNDIIKVYIIDSNETKYFWFDITGFFGKSYISFQTESLNYNEIEYKED